MGFVERAQINKTLSEKETDAMLCSLDNPESFYNHLVQYIRFRYLIEDADFWSDDLPELAEFSVAHAQETAEREGVEALQDTSLNCTGTSSAGTKQILLIMALKRALGVTMTPEELGLTNDVRALAELLRTRCLAAQAGARPQP